MQGQQVYISKDEALPTVFSGNEGAQKHFTTWMQEGLVHKTDSDVFGGYQLTKPLQLRNGVHLSIQAGGSHYCFPRKNMPYSQYESFEIGFPSQMIEELMPYVDDEENPTNTVYSCVPMVVIEAIIYKAGGVVGYKVEQIH
jgi:hypothetical protein